MLKVLYGTFDFDSIGPTPLLSFDTTIERSSAGYIIGVSDQITLRGIIDAGKTPNTKYLNDSTNVADTSIGTWIDFESGVPKLRNLQDYNSLIILCNGTEFYRSDEQSTVIESMNFFNNTDENWLKMIDYIINIRVPNSGYTDYVVENSTLNGYYISDFQDSYSITSNKSEHYYNQLLPPNPRTFTHRMPYSDRSKIFPTYNITRTLSAKGIKTKSMSAVDNAKKFISGLLLFGPRINANGIPNSLNEMTKQLTLYDRSTSIDIDVLGGSYSINDSFIATSGVIGIDIAPDHWTETFSINSEVDANLLRSVTIKGTVKGIEPVSKLPVDYSNIYIDTLDGSSAGKAGLGLYADRSSAKYINASGGFSTGIKPFIFGRILEAIYPSATLMNMPNHYPLHTGINPIPLSITVEHNVLDGIISYSYSYNSRPLALVTGAISETLNMEDGYSTRSYHPQEVYYRMPIMQDIGTRTVSTRKITYEVILPKPFLGLNLPPQVKLQIDNLMNQFNPISGLNPLGGGSTPKYFSWLTQNEEDFDIIKGKYTKTYAWKYQRGYFPSGYY